MYFPKENGILLLLINCSLAINIFWFLRNRNVLRCTHSLQLTLLWDLMARKRDYQSFLSVFVHCNHSKIGHWTNSQQLRWTPHNECDQREFPYSHFVDMQIFQAHFTWISLFFLPCDFSLASFQIFLLNFLYGWLNVFYQHWSMKNRNDFVLNNKRPPFQWLLRE